MDFIFNIFFAADRLANTLTGGGALATISGRVGCFANQINAKSFKWHWRCLEIIIDWAFYPIDGEDHCYDTARKEKGLGVVHKQGHLFARTLLLFIVPLACLIIGVISWLWLGFTNLKKKLEKN